MKTDSIDRFLTTFIEKKMCGDQIKICRLIRIHIKSSHFKGKLVVAESDYECNVQHPRACVCVSLCVLVVQYFLRRRQTLCGLCHFGGLLL